MILYYQKDIIEKILLSLNRGYKRFTLFMPLGTGRLITEFSIAVAICRKGLAKSVLYICESKVAESQARDFFKTNLDEAKIHIDFINWQKVYRNMDSVFGKYYDVIILQDVPPAGRHQLYLKLKDSSQIVISVSLGPYAASSQYDANRKVSLFVAKDKSKRASLYKTPGIYLIQTKKILDIRDIQDATVEEEDDIRTTISDNLDYFISFEQLIQDGFIEPVDFEEDDLKRRIEKLKKREKDLLDLIKGENKSND